jgi:uncharacterized protein (DUF302 family)
MTRPATRPAFLALACFLAISASALTGTTAAAEIAARDGWVVTPTSHDYATLVERIDKAAAANKIGVVTRASATVGAKRVLDKTIPGNMVIGLYHPRFAVPMLEASVAAGIEAPIRLYVTENADGTATVSYKTPSAVFVPYMDEGGEALRALAAELDEVFAKVTADAAGK